MLCKQRRRDHSATLHNQLSTRLRVTKVFRSGTYGFAILVSSDANFANCAGLPGWDFDNIVGIV
jgi:hypothetical protein